MKRVGNDVIRLKKILFILSRQYNIGVMNMCRYICIYMIYQNTQLFVMGLCIQRVIEYFKNNFFRVCIYISKPIFNSLYYKADLHYSHVFITFFVHTK